MNVVKAINKWHVKKLGEIHSNFLNYWYCRHQLQNDRDGLREGRGNKPLSDSVVFFATVNRRNRQRDTCFDGAWRKERRCPSRDQGLHLKKDNSMLKQMSRKQMTIKQSSEVLLCMFIRYMGEPLWLPWNLSSGTMYLISCEDQNLIQLSHASRI